MGRHGRAATAWSAPPHAARDAGSLQLLDTALWIMSLAELKGGTPRGPGSYIEQVRELRRAIGYDAEHVVNVALLAWSGRARAAGRDDRRGCRRDGVRRRARRPAIAALAVRDLAEGRYARRLRTGSSRWSTTRSCRSTPLSIPDFVEAAVPQRARATRRAATWRRLEDDGRRPTARPWTRGVAAAVPGPGRDDDEAEPHYLRGRSTT